MNPFAFPDVKPFTLTPGQQAAWKAGYWAGWTDRQPDVDRAEAAADRYYAEAYRKPSPTSRRR